MNNIAKWLYKNNESYFAKVIYETQSYETEEFVRTPSPMPFLHMMEGKYKTVTKYQDVPVSISQTATSPCSSLTISFSPKNQVVPWFKAFIVYIFSKTKLTVFYKVEMETEINWNKRNTQSKNQWKMLHCGLKSSESIGKMTKNILNDIEQYITDDIKSKFEEYL